MPTPALLTREPERPLPPIRSTQAAATPLLWGLTGMGSGNDFPEEKGSSQKHKQARESPRIHEMKDARNDKKGEPNGAFPQHHQRPEQAKTRERNGNEQEDTTIRRRPSGCTRDRPEP